MTSYTFLAKACGATCLLFVQLLYLTAYIRAYMLDANICLYTIRQRPTSVLNNIDVLHFDDEAAACYGLLRVDLKRNNQNY